MSDPNRYFTASYPRPFGQPPRPSYEAQRAPPPGTGRLSLAQTLRHLHSTSSSSTPSEVIVLSDSEDETPVRHRTSAQLRQSIDLTRESATSSVKRRAPFALPPGHPLRNPFSQALRLDGPSGSERGRVPSTTACISRPAHSTVRAVSRPPPQGDGASSPFGNPQNAAVNEYQAPPQSGSRIVFPTFTRPSTFSPVTGPRPSSTGGWSNGPKLLTPTSPPSQKLMTTNAAQHRVCITCARVKLKCDGGLPCGQCRQRGDRECVYSTATAPSSSAPAYVQPLRSGMAAKPARPTQPIQPVELPRPVRFAQPAQPVQPANPLQATQPTKPTGTTLAAHIPERRSLVIKLKLPSNKRTKQESAANIATSEHGSKPGSNKPNGTPDRRESTLSLQSPGRLKPEATMALELGPGFMNPPSRRTEGILVQQVTSDSETHESEQDNQVADETEVSGLLDIPGLRTSIEAKVEEMESLMEEVQKQLHAWREMSVQADLRQATIDMRTYRKPRLDSSAVDPFKAITEERRSAAGLDLKPELQAQARPQEKPQHKKLTAIRAPEHPFWTGGTLLPKYKSIGRVSASFLAPNYRTAKYRPYDAEDEIQDPDATEKYAELEQRFNNNYPSLNTQRHCQELVWLWKPWAEELLACLGLSNNDMLYFFTQDHFDPEREMAFAWSPESSRAWREEQMRRCRTCDLADPESRWTHFSETFNSLPKPDDRSLALAGLVAHAFHKLSGVSLWHIAIGGLLQPRYEDPRAMTRRAPNVCVICFRHHCPDHGSYEEPNDEDNGGKDAEELKAYINDEEQDHNHRKFMSLPIRERNDHTQHMCGVFCVDTSQKLSQLLGRQADGSVGGDSRKVSHARQVLADDESCSPSCFWDVTSRRDVKISEVKFQPFMSQSQKLLVDKLIGFYLGNQRGPCLISRIIKDVSCLMVFHYMIYRITRVPHPVADSGATSDSSTAQRHHNHARKKKKPVPIIDTSRSAELDQRPPFMPCSHDGPCHNNPACTCFRSKVHCERFCGCDGSCKRRFRGCTCTARGNKICFKDSRCECWKLNRECDPSLCGKCGVVEVLDSANKYNDEIRRGRCRNNRIQLGLPAPTTKAPSQVQGYGLYSRADISSGDFIGEYTGEIVSISEGDRRGAMYHVLNQEYLFVINKGQEIDASNNGNKMRFMNNSQREENINVEPKKLLCSGVVRVGLFAKRFIRAGEELLYNYNYPESVVKNFWEPGERPSTARRLVASGSERIARTTGANKLAGENVNNEPKEESSQSPLSRLPKRKRPVIESPLARHRFDRASTHSDEDSERSASNVPAAPEIDDSQDSDYETNGVGSDEGDVEDEPDDESDDDAVAARPASARRSSTRRSLRGGGGPARSSSNNMNAGKSRSRERKGQRLNKDMSRIHSATVSTAAKNKKELAAVKRQRKIGPHDKRLGGRAQQQAWRTRRLRESLGLSQSPGSRSA